MNKLLPAMALTAASLASLQAATLVEFTFSNAGNDIDERAGWQQAGGASLDPRVIIAQNEIALFNGTTGLTIAPLISIAPPPIPINLGMNTVSAVDVYGGTVHSAPPPPPVVANNNPINPGEAATHISAIGQFTLLNDRTPAPGALAGWRIEPGSMELQGTATNLAGILLRDMNGDIQYVTTPNANGLVNFTFDLSSRDPIEFNGPMSYTLFLVGLTETGPATGLSFSGGNNDFIRYNGEVVPIPEPSVYMAGATAIMLGGFLYIRRRKAAKGDLEASQA